MANDYYTVTGNPSTRANGSSQVQRNEWGRVAASFDKCAPLTGNGNKLVRVNSGGTAQEAATLLGTANQVTVTHGAGTITLSVPAVFTVPGNISTSGGGNIAASGDMSLAATNTLYLNGQGGNSFIREAAGGLVRVVAGGGVACDFRNNGIDAPIGQNTPAVAAFTTAAADAIVTGTIKTSGTTTSGIANATPTALFSFTAGAVLVQASISTGSAAAYTAWAIFGSTGAGNMRRLSGQDGTNLTLSASGDNVMVTQSSGSANNVTWSMLQLG